MLKTVKNKYRLISYNFGYGYILWNDDHFDDQLHCHDAADIKRLRD